MAKTYSNFTDIITISRASTATYRASNGYVMSAAVDESRLDYDNAGNLLGILLEPQRTNLLPYSNALDNAGWYKVNASVSASSAVSPANTTTLKIVEDNTSATHTVGDGGLTLTANSDYCFSAFVRTAERSSVRFIIGDGIDSYAAYFHLSNASVGSLLNTSTAGIIPYSDGWYRCYVAAEVSGTAGGVQFRTAIDDSDSYAGDGTSGLYVWGAQLERGRYPSSLIYTDGAQATRALDYLSIPTDAFKYSSNSGTVLLEVEEQDSNNIAFVYDYEANVKMAYTNTSSGYNTIAISYSSNSNIGGLAVNGVTYTYDNPTPNVYSSVIDIISDNAITHIKRLSYYPRALSLEYIGELTR